MKATALTRTLVLAACIAFVASLAGCKGYGGGGTQPPPDKTTGETPANK